MEELVKRCTKCIKLRAIEEFDLRKDTGKFRTICKACRRGYQLNRRLLLNPNLKIRDKYLVSDKPGWKICSKCKIEKLTIEFHNDSVAKDGKRHWCISCSNDYSNGWNKNNPEKHNQNQKKWVADNLEQAKEICKNWQINNKAHRTQYHKHKKQTDVNYKLRDSLRSRLRGLIKRPNRSGSAVKDLGCSVKELRTYLELKFYPNPVTGEMMSWENHGSGSSKWQIDHINALCSFDLTNREQFLEAVHYTNLQPLWYRDHIKKHKHRE